MSGKFLKYILITGLVLSSFILIQTCSAKNVGNKSLYIDKLEIVHINKQRDTINVVYFDYIYINQDWDLVKKDGTLISKSVKKYKYLSHEKTTL